MAKLPESEQNRVRFNYWSALTDASSVMDGKLRLQVLISELEDGGYESVACCLADDLDHLSCTFASPCDIANGRGARISSNDHSVRSAAARR